MPNLTEHPNDLKREAAYRRGYTHGIESMMSGVVDIMNDAEKAKFEAWFSKVLTSWARSDPSQVIMPPDFPRLDR